TGIAGIDGDVRAIVGRSEEKRLAPQPVPHTAKIIQQQAIDNLLDALAVGGAGGKVSPLSQGLDGVGNGYAALAGAEQGMVILSIADGHDVVMREAHF